MIKTIGICVDLLWLAPSFQSFSNCPTAPIPLFQRNELILLGLIQMAIIGVECAFSHEGLPVGLNEYEPVLIFFLLKL